jgi:uncharacterized membrane protein YebE (DUF533 family)
VTAKKVPIRFLSGGSTYGPTGATHDTEVNMRFNSILGSLLGSFGGRALGNAIGGRHGAMIGSLAGSLLGAKGAGSMGGGAGGLGSLLKQAMGNRGAADGGARRLADTDSGAAGLSAAAAVPETSDDENEVLIMAMCFAAKADGTVDEKELAAITGRLGELERDEVDYVKAQLAGAPDLDALAARVPAGFEAEVYAASLLAIDSVNGAEAGYLKDLAAKLRLSADDVAQIQQAVGV